MNNDDNHSVTDSDRRMFFKAAAGLTITAALPSALSASENPNQGMLQVWSCGGLAEAFNPANECYEKKTGIKIAYTGAFAAALGKSLLGSATTEVFAGRVLGLAKKLRSNGKMLYFKPLCYTSYVMATPKNNPAKISSIHDLANPSAKVILAPEASPPGGKAVAGLLKKAGVLEQAMKNCVIQGSCVQRTMQDLVDGKGNVSIVEKRLTRMPQFAEKTEIIPIPQKYFPPPPLTFTIGVMSNAKNKNLANSYTNFILSEEGQQFFEDAGFIPAVSDEGKHLTEKLGVYDA